MELKLLEDFVCLARTGNFSRAAEERNVTQPAFSRRIKQLESWLGSALIDRSTYPTRLTPAGADFLQVAKDNLAALYEARAVLRRGQPKTKRTLVFAAQHTLTLTFFPRWLAETERAVGPVDVRMYAENLHNCVQSLSDGVCDLMLCYSHPGVPVHVDPAHFAYRVIGEDLMLPVCAADANGAPRYPLPGKPGHPLPFLAFGGQSFLGRIVDGVMRRGEMPLHLALSYEDSFAEALKVMALAGRGVGWLPRRAVADALDAGRLVRAGDERWDEPVEIRLYRANADDRPLIAAVWRSG